jgi:hypothetical protein
VWDLFIAHAATTHHNMRIMQQSCEWAHRWLLPEGRKASRPDGAHPEALPAARRGRRALCFAAPGQQGAGAHPAAAATSINSKSHSNGAGSAGGKGNDQQPVVAPPSGNGYQQSSAAGAPAEHPVLPPAADLQGVGHSATASDGGPAKDTDAWRLARREAEEEYGGDEEGPEGASDEEAALERKSATDGTLPRCVVSVAITALLSPMHAHWLTATVDGEWQLASVWRLSVCSDPVWPRCHRGVKTYASAAALLLLLTALFTALLAVDGRRSHAARRALWLSVLMGALCQICCKMKCRCLSSWITAVCAFNHIPSLSQHAAASSRKP